MTNPHASVPSKRGGIGSHTTLGGTNEWLTPPELLDALGPFDLDPCAPIERPWPIAARHFTQADDGLAQRWEGFVWCNPPYGRETFRWLSKLADHGDGLALIFARTETFGFFAQVWERATAVMFLEGRLTFRRPDGSVPRDEGGGNAGGPSCLVAYGHAAEERLWRSGLRGAIVNTWTVIGAQQRLSVRERL